MRCESLSTIRRCVSVAVLSFSLMHSALADIPVGKYAQFKKSEPGFTDYLIGAGRGVLGEHHA